MAQVEGSGRLREAAARDRRSSRCVGQAGGSGRGKRTVASIVRFRTAALSIKQEMGENSDTGGDEGLRGDRVLKADSMRRGTIISTIDTAQGSEQSKRRRFERRPVVGGDE
jgi:hypothetical protein